MPYQVKTASDTISMVPIEKKIRHALTYRRIELCQFDIYAKCVQFKGAEKKIFNSES